MTMTNAEWMIKQGYKFRELDWICDNALDYGYVILLKNECIGKVKDCYSTKAITTWLDMEHKEPILDDAEKRYLSAVIKPFRKRVEYISKEEDFDGPFDGPAEFIHIELSDGDIADFPDFKANTMYKDMKLGYEYSLEELGL